MTLLRIPSPSHPTVAPVKFFPPNHLSIVVILLKFVLFHSILMCNVEIVCSIPSLCNTVKKTFSIPPYCSTVKGISSNPSYNCSYLSKPIYNWIVSSILLLELIISTHSTVGVINPYPLYCWTYHPLSILLLELSVLENPTVRVICPCKSFRFLVIKVKFFLK